eukprot:scaffold5978_cov157-Amphora_coffeaeformis.AAC.7
MAPISPEVTKATALASRDMYEKITDQALEHLQRRNPTANWSIQKGSLGYGTIDTNTSDTGYRLLSNGKSPWDARKNKGKTNLSGSTSSTKSSSSSRCYMALYHDKNKTDSVVGILSMSDKNTATAQVLADGSGKPLSKPLKLVTVTIDTVTDEGEHDINKNNGCFVEELTSKRILVFSVLSILAVLTGIFLAEHIVLCFCLLFLAVLYLYLLLTCPPDASFDATRELSKRIRPESGLWKLVFVAPDHRWLIEKWFGGAIKLAFVSVPSKRMVYIWIGAANRWFYVCSRERDDHNSTSKVYSNSSNPLIV